MSITEFLLLTFVITQYIGLALCFYYIFKQKKEIEYLKDTCVHYFADTDGQVASLEHDLETVIEILKEWGDANGK